MATQSLKDKTIKGVGWSAADAYLGYCVTLIVGIILARLLSPDEYGLIGLTTIFIVVLESIVDSGFSTSLIRKKDVTEDDYNTMFYTNLGVSIVMYVVLFFCAPLISSFFDREELVSLVRVMGLLIIIQALSIVQYTVLSKRIDFKTKTKASLLSAIISGVIGVGMAFTGFGVWALVGQRLSKEFFYTMLLWVFNKWWPKLRYSIDSLRYMWGFGWKLLLSGLLDRTWAQLYQVVVGKFYNPSTLGQYSKGKEFPSFLSVNFQTIIGRVTYPVLAEVQDDTTRLVSAYRRIIKTTMFVTVISVISLGAVSEPFIFCLIGPQWQQAATFMPFICFSMSLYPLHAINLNMLKVLGRSDIFLYLEIVKKIIAIGPLCLGIFVGIYWMLIGSIVIGFIAFFINTYYTGKKLGYTSWMQLKDVAPSYGIAFLIGLSVYFLKYLPISYWIILPLQVIIGLSVFIIACERIKLVEYVELKDIMKAYLKKMVRH
ncbi:MAG: lipopolysaccharide biosynthesis protein [Bacteroidaceae bacterium]|nr:lipopolysaccharide biosynthesis protein [Bacteroidaceae bacterium]